MYPSWAETPQKDCCRQRIIWKGTMSSVFYCSFAAKAQWCLNWIIAEQGVMDVGSCFFHYVVITESRCRESFGAWILTYHYVKYYATEYIHSKMKRVNYSKCSLGNEGLPLHDMFRQTLMCVLKCVIESRGKEERRTLTQRNAEWAFSNITATLVKLTLFYLLHTEPLKKHKEKCIFQPRVLQLHHKV